MGRKSTREQARDKELGEEDEEDEEGGDGGDGETAAERKRVRLANNVGASREELKRRPRVMYRTVVRREGTTVSVPLVAEVPMAVDGDEDGGAAAATTAANNAAAAPYVARWAAVFGNSSTTQQTAHPQQQQQAIPSAS